METIFQSIEILSKEKGIDPQIILDAVKDAMLIAARKHYRTNEDYIAEMDAKAGVRLFAVKKAVEGRRTWEGLLAGYADGMVGLETEPGKTREFPFEQVQKANLKFEW